MARRAESLAYDRLGLLDPISRAIASVPGVETADKFGRINDVDTGTTPEDIWNGQGLYTGQPEDRNAERLELFSSDAADDFGTGTGAWTVRLFGEDALGNSQTEDVNLDGVTGVLTNLSYARMPRMRVIAAGTGRVNAGQITARQQTTTSNVMVVMPIGTNRTAICAASVPLGKTAVLLSYKPTAARGVGTGYAGVRLLTREPGLLFEARDFLDCPIQSAIPPIDLGGIVLPELSDFKAQVFEVSDSNTAVSCRINYVLLDNATFGL